MDHVGFGVLWHEFLLTTTFYDPFGISSQWDES